MKKIGILLISVMLLGLFGCSGNKNMESSANVSERSVVAESPAKIKKDIGELLENTFMELWKSDIIYIDVEMTVENNEDSNQKDVYKYILASDKNKKTAMINMDQPDNKKLHCIIENDKIYYINDSEKNYKISDYKNTIDEFIKAYTKDMNLGVSESIQLSEDGTTDFKGEKDIAFEKYAIVSTEKNASSITITYYFKDEKPYAEVMQSDKGKTTFIFKSADAKISDNSIFKVPSDYSKKE